LFDSLSRTGPLPLRAYAATIARQLRQGQSLAAALALYQLHFPPLFLEMVRIGEKTGRLEETFQVLEEYYDAVYSTQKQFYAELIYPVLIYFLAVLVIALLIMILGFLGGQGRAVTTDPLGLGLRGVGGAVTFAAVAWGLPLAVLVAIRWLGQKQQWRQQLEAFLLWVPAWGPAMHCLALQRCAVALRLGYASGLSVPRVLRHALQATSNAAFSRGVTQAVAVVKRGGTLSEALAASGAPFPEQFYQYVHLGEETGNMPEILAKVVRNYTDESIRQLRQAARLTAWGIYALVCLLILVAIFQLASLYLQAIGQMVG
jgi:type II secretory pathway component PulF